MSDQRGFTLVEVLAALVVGGLLLASLSWVLAGLGKDLRTAGRHDDLAQVESIAPLLKHLLEGALFPSGSDDVTITERHLTMLVAPPGALANEGPLRLSLSVDRMPDGQSLAVSLARGDGGKLPEAYATPQILARGFKAIEIAGTGPEGETGVSLPAMVTLTFIPKSGDPVSIVAQPRLTSDSACQFDPISMSCRA